MTHCFHPVCLLAAAAGMYFHLTMNNVMAAERTLFDFTTATNVPGWQVVNDDVMGGVSTGKFDVTNGVASFRGKLSLENSGGFASVRSLPSRHDLAGCDAFLIRVREANPRGLVLPRIYLTTPDWWVKANPDECQVLSHRGKHYRQGLGHGRDDTFYASRSYVCLNADGAGERTLHFPRAVDLFDPFTDLPLARRVARFDHTFEDKESLLIHYRT